MPAPIAVLSPLPRADGSATYTQDGYSVMCSVNGPLEVSRKDEIPEEATIEVHIRPASGVGTPKERHLESLIHSTLRHAILVRNYPRSLIQVTLQILQLPEGDVSSDRTTPSTSSLPLLPPLLQATALGLITASIPLSTTFTSTILTVSRAGAIAFSPTPADLAAAASTHVFAFAVQDARLLLAESEGRFGLDTWTAACAAAEGVCRASASATDEDVDTEMAAADAATPENLERFFRRVVKEKVEREQRWRNAE